MSTNDKSPERALWCAVLHKAFTDATMNVRESGKRQMAINIVDRNHARAWLLSQDDDFREVCSLAGYDPDYIHDQACALSRKGWQTGIGKWNTRRTSNNWKWRSSQPGTAA